MEQIIFYILIFSIGCMFGSFSTLAVYRIPLHQNITHKRSYCPNCNHRLEFLDLIPVLSYIFLGGKCRYCKKKIRIRYFLLEILTGIVFLLFAMFLKISLVPFEISKAILLGIYFLYLIGIIIIAGIDKENKKIEKSLVLYEIIIATLYIVYLYVVNKVNIYTYAIYLIILTILILVDNVYLRKKLKDNYTLQILELSIIMAIFSGSKAYIISVILTILEIVITVICKIIYVKRKKVIRKESSYYTDLPMGFYLGCSNIVSLILISLMYM